MLSECRTPPIYWHQRVTAHAMQYASLIPERFTSNHSRSKLASETAFNKFQSDSRFTVIFSCGLHRWLYPAFSLGTTTGTWHEIFRKPMPHIRDLNLYDVQTPYRYQTDSIWKNISHAWMISISGSRCYSIICISRSRKEFTLTQSSSRTFFRPH